MTHDQIADEIMRRARARGLRVHYCPDSRRCKGDSGMPDLVFVGQLGGTGWIEVKMPGDVIRPGQTTWMHTLRAAGQPCEIMTERDLSNGTVDLFLDQL
jgi:hypothetical protein